MYIDLKNILYLICKYASKIILRNEKFKFLMYFLLDILILYGTISLMNGEQN